MLRHGCVHYLLVDHPERVLLLDLIDDAVFAFKRLIVQIFVLKVFDHVRRQLAAPPPIRECLLLSIQLLLLLLLRQPNLLRDDLFLDFMLGGRARRTHTHVRLGASCSLLGREGRCRFVFDVPAAGRA